MVQVLEPGTSFGSEFGRAVGSGIGAAGAGYFQGKFQKSMEEKTRKSQADAIKKLTGMDISGLPPEAQNEFVKQFGKYAAQEQMLGRLFPSKKAQTGMGDELRKGEPQPSSDLMNLGPEEQLKLAMINPELAKVSIEQEKMKSKSSAAEQSKREFGHKQGEKFRDELRADAKSAEEVKYGAKLMKDAIRSGKTGATGRNLALKYLESAHSPLADLFATPESGKMNIGLKTFAGGFKKIMGSQPTQREFFWYENILPSLLKSAPTNEAIIDYFDRASDFPIKAQEIYDNIVQSNEGYIPIDIDQRVRAQMKPEFDQLVNEGMGLMSEVDENPKKGKKSPVTKEKVILSEMPDPKSNKGKYITDQDTGERFKSDGTQWVPVNA